ncbi:MAG: 3-deoxy-manno-octulosonate cytidylyltransferase [Candidatus Krumholzibacteriota bacterium]|nr:3-deoxy-manno-octulosonate cytidylyltransferase [Candidatus Krumholzibacteriota bacterium]
MSSQKVTAVIPARYGSKRFPGKPLALINGTPMIVHVLRRAESIKGIDSVLVATDDRRIADVVNADSGRAVITSGSHDTGTSRVCEVVSENDCDIVLNIQGDEPLFPVDGVEKLIEVMKTDRSIKMGTLASFSDSEVEMNSRDVVKVVFDLSGNALYFSRLPVGASGGGFYRHIGIYIYRSSFLLDYENLPGGPLEKIESLEQLRALENGIDIRVINCSAVSGGVDRPEDIKRVESFFDNL